VSDDPTTGRARRQQAVETGATDSAVDRVSDRYNPTPRGSRTTSRARQQQLASEVAGDIDVDREGVGTIDRIGGMDVFLRGPGPRQFGQQVADEFASSADFVTGADVAPNVNAADISAAPAVAEGRRDDVAQRARQQTAADAQFITRDDLDVEVGDRGVTGLGVAPGRRDDVAQRAERGLAADDPFAKPGDFDAEVSASGIESAGLTDAGARRRAGRQFESETPLGSVDPATDVTATSDGAFRLNAGAQERIAARRFEDQFDAFGQGELDSSDVRETGSGFGLGESAAREVAADRLSEQAGTDVSPGEIQLEDTGSGFEAVFGGDR